ncbi:polysaccharide biosynthesis/export family protein [Dyadobacter subterraneus]|uniref:Polysaccharide biosynthesis/export family protein n=1 Tax=Dyadobacter subterraneus TaxID=2773304 RepID=A0ABR9WLV7_9BACT|nr:polysaccharide biosynthesis/export family protein [Dyadobacter subterraneus]MBE9466390.1 polysaccharide biosynthesis/export family protein [Dyadobacter subterraneus]
MFSRINSCVGLLLLAITISCATQKKSPTIISEKLITAPVQKSTGAYLIQPGNKLLIHNLNWSSRLFPEPDKIENRQSISESGYPAQVNSEGNINMPEIGKIHVSGLTRSQLADSLIYRYKDIIRDPIFDVEITNLRVKVLGACTIQGLVTLDKETQTLDEVLAKAGGIKYNEAGNSIQIIRGDGKEQKIIEYDFQQMGNPQIMNISVFDNDIIYVPPSREGIRSVRLSRKLVILQPVLIALNLALLIVNITR